MGAIDIEQYRKLIAARHTSFEASGFADATEDRMPGWLFPHQKHGVSFALRTGCSALFYDTGLGKTGMSLAWGDEIVRRTNRPVLMLAPLAVTAQHLAEAGKFGIEAVISRDGTIPNRATIALTNYERLEKFDHAEWGGVILDESSILKGFNGKTTRRLIDAFNATPYRLAATATPAPNDHSEIGTHSEFLGSLSRDQMLMRWFIHDSADTGTWRMKGHAAAHFWDWVASWARCVSKPSDLGFSDDGFNMPELVMTRHLVSADRSIDAGEDRDGQAFLFRMPNTSATSIHKEKRMTSEARAAKVAEIVSRDPDEPWIIWCDTDYDAEAMRSALPSVVEVSGSMSVEEKEARLHGFTTGQVKHLLTKASIAGFGLNWQHCARMAFMGLSFSYESFYQAIRRCWRFRQSRDVHVHVVCADTEEAIWQVVSRKAGDHDRMKAEMASAMARAARRAEALQFYRPNQEAMLPAWLSA